MFWNRLLQRIKDPGALARAQHSLWLTRALESGKDFPRIPLRPVRSGGFSSLMARPHGPQHAARWWEKALAKVHDEP
jgi:hypothetical protein